MFQNISKDFDENQNEFEDVKINKKNNLIDWIKTAIRGQNILLYIVAFMLSLVDGNVGMSYSIFAFSIFAATSSNGIPVGILYIITMIGTFIKFQTSGLLTYIFTSFIFIAMLLIFKPKRILEEYQNEKQKLGKFVFLSILVGQVIISLFKNILIYDILISISSAMIGFIFYKIFSKSIIVLSEIRTKRAFALEEIMGAVLMVSIAATSLGDFKILGLGVSNIISILLVLILGWKNGILVGTTSGVTVGVVLGIITNSSPILIAAFAISGLLSGVLSKFGKIGVIVGFVAGNLILTYVYNGDIVELIHFKEILVASLALILIPNKIEINIQDLFGKNVYLEEGARYRLNESKEAVQKINDVSNVIKEMSNTYMQVAATTVDEKEIKENNKEIFISELENNIENLKENILYEDIADEDENILGEIFDKLQENDIITRDDILEIYKNNNSYIIGFDNKDTALSIEKDINDMVNVINKSYETSILNFVVKAKLNETNKNVSNQLNGVSKALESIVNDIQNEKTPEFIKEKKEIITVCKQRKINVADLDIKQEKSGRFIIKFYLNTCEKENNIECPTKKIEEILYKVFNEEIILSEEKCGIKLEQNICYQTYISKDKYSMQIGISKTNKEGETVSGDSSIQIKLKDGKYLFALSDGMGSGPEARKSSQIAVKMLGRLLSNGFDKETSIELINNTILSNNKNETYATLDTMILDLYSGNSEYIKNGAAPTFIKNKKNVDIIKSIALPTGILNNVDLVVFDRDLEDGDIIVMCTDGIVESNKEYTNKEIWVKNILENIETENVQKIADIILKEAIDNNYGNAADDMSIIVVKVKKKLK